MGGQQADVAQQGLRRSDGCSRVAAKPDKAARWCWRQGRRAVQGPRARAGRQWIIPGGAFASLSFRCTQGQVSPRRKLQILSKIGQWCTSQALPFVIRGEFQVDPKQLEDSGWVRAIGGFVVIAPQLATAASGPSISSSSLETFQARVKQKRRSGSTLYPQARQNRCFHAALPTQEAGSEQARPLAGGQVGCVQEAGERDLDQDLVRRRVQEAAGAQAGWTPFIDPVEEELTDAFPIAQDDADAFRGTSQGQKLAGLQKS